VTVETLLGELEEARSGATSAAQYGAATHATLGKARLAGLMRDKIEIGGPGEFDLKTPEDVVDRMLDQDDPERLVAALDALRGLILQRASERAVVVLEEPPPFRSDEVAQSLALLRPPPKGAHRSA
jgi:hypothetical protein